jgi:acylphosphatase
LRAVSILVTGRVQGVFFRKYTIAVAEKHAIAGFVKNTASGDVYIEAQGTVHAIDELIKWCYKGSPVSKVQKVEVKEIPIVKISGFKIRYE